MERLDYLRMSMEDLPSRLSQVNQHENVWIKKTSIVNFVNIISKKIHKHIGRKNEVTNVF